MPSGPFHRFCNGGADSLENDTFCVLTWTNTVWNHAAQGCVVQKMDMLTGAWIAWQIKWSRTYA
jgi:hypothetical protein